MAERIWVAAIDTSTEWAGVALTDGANLVELNWSAGRQQTTQVAPELNRIMQTAGIAIADIGAAVVATGPGSFSGLRVGISIANGMAMAADIPVIGVSTLASTVWPWQSDDKTVVGVVRAGRARYAWASDRDLADAITGTISELVEFIRESRSAVVVGELAEVDAIRLRELTDAHVPPAPGRLRSAGNLAQIGWERWRAGGYDPIAIPEPIYLHRT